MTILAQRRAQIGSKQYGNKADFNNIGIFAVNAMDAMGLDILGSDRGWAGMAVSRESSTSVRVTLGRAWKDGKFYANVDADSSVLVLNTVLPTASSVIVAIVATGTETPAAEQQRLFKDAQTGVKESQPWFTEMRRAMTVGFVVGGEAPTPLPPFIEPNYVPIAYVRLTPAGIPEEGGITMLTDYRLPTQQGMQARLLSLETFRQAIGTRVETLATDLAAIGSRVNRFNLPAVMQGLSRLAELEDMLGIDEGAQLQGFDRYMDEDDSDIHNVNYKARVEEGLRAPWAAEKEFAPQLKNADDPKLVTRSGWTLPVHTKELRLDIWGQFQSVNIANYQMADASFTVYPGAKRRRRYGSSYVYASNSAFWQKAAYSVNYIAKTFMVDGETYNITDEWIEDGVTYYRVEQYWDDKIPYWNGYQTVTHTAANGYLVGQTFLNAQAGWLVELDLRFGRVDPAKGLNVFICEVVNGEPSYDRIIATGSVAAGAVKMSPANDAAGVPTTVVVTPVFLEAGKRYGVIVSSSGDHAIACRNDNALSNGGFFIGDGNTWENLLAHDMNLRLRFAKFTAPYVMVQLKDDILNGGVSNIDAVTREMVPDGTEMYLMMRIDNEFHRFEKVSGTHPLASLPQRPELFLVMVGTTDVMPAINMSESRIRLLRIDDDFAHYSISRNAGAPVTEVTLTFELWGWKPGKHTLAAAILSGANTNVPNTITDYPQSNGSIRRVMTFALTGSPSAYVIRVVGSTTDINDWFVITKREDLAAA